MDKDNVIIPTNVTEFAQYKFDEHSTECDDSSSCAVSLECESTVSHSSTELDENRKIDPIMQQEFEDALKSNEKETSTPTIGWRDVKALKRSRYLEVKDKYDKAFVLANRRTKQIVEIQAASSLQACHMIGWKPRCIKVLDILNVKDREQKIKDMVDNTDVEDSGNLEQNDETKN